MAGRGLGKELQGKYAHPHPTHTAREYAHTRDVVALNMGGERAALDRSAVGVSVRTNFVLVTIVRLGQTCDRCLQAERETGEYLHRYTCSSVYFRS